MRKIDDLYGDGADDIRQTEAALFSDSEVKQHAPRPENRPPESHVGLGLKGKERKSEQHNPRPNFGMDQKKQFTFSFYPKRIRKTLVVFLFLFLAVSFFYNPFYAYFPWNSGKAAGLVVSDAVEQGMEIAEEKEEQAEAEPAKEEAGEEEKKEAEEKKEVEEKKEEEKEPEAEPKKEEETDDELETVVAKPTESSTEDDDDSSDKITISVEGTKTQLKEWGGKITEVSFVVENRFRAFTPKVKVYAYDDKTRADFKKIPILQKYEPLEKNKRLKGTIDISRFQFQDTKKEKTILLQLYDEGSEPGYAGDKKLTELEHKVMITG